MSEQLKGWTKAEYMRQGITFLLNRIFRYSQYLLEWFPYKKDRVCCVTLTRKGYTDNMMYVTQALKEKWPSVEIVWVTKYPETCDRAVENDIRVVTYHTIKHFYLQFTSRILISDDSLYHGLIKRRKQMYLNVWHGGINYKQLGKEGMCFENALMRKLFESRNPSPDYMVAGSHFFEENMKEAFDFNKTVFLKSGLPRNDVFFNNIQQGKIKRFYHIENTGVILYAPTFRTQKDNAIVGRIDFRKLIEAARKRYGGEWIVLYRAHYFVQDTEVEDERVIDVSNYENMQEILIDTDILISDYSSCMWDYSFLHRPIIIYAPDETNYCEKERGLTTAGRNMPFPKSHSMDELIGIMEDHDFDADVEKIKLHHKEMGAYDTGNATKYVTDFIIAKFNEVKENRK